MKVRKDGREESSEGDRSPHFKEIAQIRYLLPSGIWLILIFFLMEWIKTSRIYYYPQIEKMLLVLFASWALSTAVTYRYSRLKRSNIYYYISPYLKAGILMLLFISIFYFFLRLEPLSRFLLFGTAIVHSSLEVIAFGFIFLIRNIDIPGNGIGSTTDADPKDTKDYYLNDSPNSNNKGISLSQILHRAVSSESDIYKMLSSASIVNRVFDENEVNVISTNSPFNIDVLGNETFEVIINLEALNNFRRINQYLLRSHQKIKAGGWLIGSYTALEDDWNRVRSKMPKLIFLLLYPLYFLIHRVFPKIPYLKSIYFLFTRGHNRKLSRAEVLGRLSFSGFEIVEERRSKTVSYFIAQKVKIPSNVVNPSYGPVIQLERIGYLKERIHIYKFRTMHPYSEFIQKNVYESNALNAKGKLQDDFRVTKWGKFVRKLWIDELPQLLNWLRGDVSIVGVRALSEHYFSLYPTDLQELRTQFKPGLVPPYYADLPDNFDEILKSEREYLLKKEKHPMRTDFTYFWKAFYNIILKGARSS